MCLCTKIRIFEYKDNSNLDSLPMIRSKNTKFVRFFPLYWVLLTTTAFPSLFAVNVCCDVELL